MLGEGAVMLKVLLFVAGAVTVFAEVAVMLEFHFCDMCTIS